jgi:hypothetical protein
MTDFNAMTRALVACDTHDETPIQRGIANQKRWFMPNYSIHLQISFVFQKREKNLRFFDVTYSPPIPV